MKQLLLQKLNNLKKIIITLSCIISFFCISLLIGFVWYKTNISPVSKDSQKIEFTINNGTSTKKVIDDLYENGLIKNNKAAYIHVKLNKYNLQAGFYELDKNMSLKEILTKFNKGEVIDNSITVTFIEGKKITDFVKTINKSFGYSEEEILNTLQDKEYLQELIDKYWFLTDDILNDKLYYALEGYLHPNTYTFKNNATIKEIIEKLLSSTDKILTKYKDSIENSKYTIHELLTMSSIVELEGEGSNDRAGVAGVFYNRLNSGWNLGSDVTAYYGAKLELSEREINMKELADINGYNTRPAEMAGKLPIGPICNPSEESINATINPEIHNYYYFVADKTKKTYFFTNYDEFIKKINELKQNGLWYEYN